MEEDHGRATSFDRGWVRDRADAKRKVLRLAHRIRLKTLGYLRAPIGRLARLSGTDKIGAHNYMGAYDRFFSEYRNRPVGNRRRNSVRRPARNSQVSAFAPSRHCPAVAQPSAHAAGVAE